MSILTKNCLAQVTSWTLNTNRDTVDVSGLGDQFRKQFSGMVSGSGTVECLFDYDYHRSQEDCDNDYDKELPIFMHKLAIRQEVGSTFTGMFLMRQAYTMPIADLVDRERVGNELFYLCECVVTNVATELAPTEMIRSSIDFVTTGKIQLLFAYPADQLLQEDGDGLLSPRRFRPEFECSGLWLNFRYWLGAMWLIAGSLNLTRSRLMSCSLKVDLLVVVDVSTNETKNITPAALAEGSVGSLPDGSIPGSAIELNSLTGEHLQENTITERELADGSVGTNQIIDGSITEDKFDPNIDLGNIAIGDNSIDGNQIKEDAIDGDYHIQDRTITGIKLVENTITSAEIAAGCYH